MSHENILTLNFKAQKFPIANFSQTMACDVHAYVWLICHLLGISGSGLDRVQRCTAETR